MLSYDLTGRCMTISLLSSYTSGFVFSNYLADSANMLGKSGAIQILANVIHNDCLDTEDKIKVTITLGHAMENSGLLLLYMLLFLHVISMIMYFWYKKYQV